MTLILNGTDNSATTPAVTGTDPDTGVYYPAANQVALATNGTLALIADSAQHIGLNVVPNSNWPSSWSVLETRGGNNFWGVQGQVQVGYNNYYDGTNYRYSASSNRAERLILTDAGFYFDSAAIGTAGNAVTFETQMQIGYQQTVALRGAAPQSGTGITFPAIQSASSDVNTLDDYEEGDWTPVITGSATNPTVSYTANRGRYTKIGRIVSVTCQLSTSSLSGGSGTLRISGLPFANGFVTWAGGAMAYASTSSATAPSICMIETGSTYFAFWAGTTAVTLGTISGIDWYFSATYNV